MIFYQINETHASFSFAIEQGKETTTGNRNESRTINNWSLQNCTHSGTTNQFSSRHPGHENWISLNGKPSSSKKRSTFALWLPRMDQNGFLQRFEMPKPRKAISHGSNSGSQKKPSKGAAVFPEVKRMIKRLKTTPANPASASSTLNEPWFRSGRLGLGWINVSSSVHLRSHKLAYYKQHQHFSNYLEK